MSHSYSLFAVTLIWLAIAGCNHPLGTPDLTGFAPWERLPDGNGITYVHQFRTGHSMNPTFLALFEYSSDQALKRAVDTG